MQPNVKRVDVEKSVSEARARLREAERLKAQADGLTARIEKAETTGDLKEDIRGLTRQRRELETELKDMGPELKTAKAILAAWEVEEKRARKATLETETARLSVRRPMAWKPGPWTC